MTDDVERADRVVLVVEDGDEWVTAFRRVAEPARQPVRLAEAKSLAEAQTALAAGGVVGIFLDVVFDRVPGDALAGDLDGLAARFGGDEARARRHLETNQGFFLLDALAPDIPPGTSVVIAYDFGAEPGRLSALRARVPGLAGLPDGAPLEAAWDALVRSGR